MPCIEPLHKLHLGYVKTELYPNTQLHCNQQKADCVQLFASQMLLPNSMELFL